jgi:uncharacterized protein YbaR (Trm112 family)
MTESVANSESQLDPRMVAILACPEDKGPLYYLPDEASLYNPRLKRVYPVRGEIPVMLVEHARSVEDEEHDRIMAKVEDEGIKPSFEG